MLSAKTRLRATSMPRFGEAGSITAGYLRSFVCSDFPHESFDAKHCRKEINELLERDDISKADKEAILATNAKRFYGVDR